MPTAPAARPRASRARACSAWTSAARRTPTPGLPTATPYPTPVPAHSDTITFTDVTGNYNDTSRTVTGEVKRADATLVVSGYAVNYDGNAHSASGSATGVKGESLLGLDFSGTTHTNAVAAHSDTITFTGVTGNYHGTSRTVTDGIAKAEATLSVSGYAVTYDGNAHSASGSATGVKGESLLGLDFSGKTHTTAVAAHSDTIPFTDVTGNYNDTS